MIVVMARVLLSRLLAGVADKQQLVRCGPCVVAVREALQEGVRRAPRRRVGRAVQHVQRLAQRGKRRGHGALSASPPHTAPISTVC
jgi:hypothetical protein